MRFQRASRGIGRRGFFLILVLIVIVIATLSVYSFTGLMIAYDDSAYLTGDLVQARVTVESAAEAVRLILAEPPETRVDFGGIYNNPNLFQAVTVSNGVDGVTPCNFSIVAPDLSETGSLGGLRFGLQDESARLNINALTIIEQNWQGLSPLVAVTGAEEATSDNIAVLLLLGLPGMTEDIANAIMDWLDEDDDERNNSFEFDYYGGLPTPYEPTNGPIQSVEELLLVEGVTPTLLFGADTNRNGILDADEQQRFNVTVDTPGALGWAAYMTVHSAEANKRNNGAFRINVNQDDLETLAEELSELENEDYSSFILAYRIAGQPTGSSALAAAATGGDDAITATTSQQQVAGVWTADLLEQFDLSGGGGNKLNQILDLIDARVTVGQGDQAQTYASPFSGDPISMAVYMPILMDMLSTQDVEMMPGRININQCPAELLYGMGLLTEEQVEMILQDRETESDDPNRQYETWPLVEGILTVDQMRSVIPLVNAGGDVYRAQIVGYFEGSNASHRSEVIIDATSVNPKIISWRDLSHLGRGFDRSVLGIRSLESVTGPQ